MSKGNKPQGGKSGGDDAAAKCPVDGCAKTGVRINFCQEHFTWFKEGLVTRKGERPTDFDRKYQGFLSRKATAKKATA